MAEEHMIERENLQDTGPVQVVPDEGLPEGHQAIGGGAAAGGSSHAGEAPHWGRRALLAGGALLASIGIGYGVDQAVNSGGGNERPAIATGLTPTTEPTNAPSPTVEVTPTAKVEPTEAPKAEAKSPYKFVNAVTQNGVTMDVTEGMLTRTEGPDNVYSGEETKKVPYYSLHGMEFNTAAFPEAAQMVHDGFQYALQEAWSVQDNIPQNQQDLVINPSDSDEVKLQKFHALQDRMAKGEVFDIKIKANKDDSFVLEDIDMKWDKDWTYAIDEVDTPTPFITWQTDGRTGVRISPDAKKFSVELFYRYAGAQGFFSEKTFIASQTVDTLKYLPELTRTNKIPDLLVPTSNTQESLRPRAVDIGQKFFIPDMKINNLGKDWKDSVIHPLP